MYHFEPTTVYDDNNFLDLDFPLNLKYKNGKEHVVHAKYAGCKSINEL